MNLINKIYINIFKYQLVLFNKSNKTIETYKYYCSIEFYECNKSHISFKSYKIIYMFNLIFFFKNFIYLIMLTDLIIKSNILTNLI